MRTILQEVGGRGENTMNKQEFEERLHGRMVSDKDFAKISEVYNTHPSIDAVKGKDQIAELYEKFGMRIIEDMLPTAREAAAMVDEMMSLNMKINKLKEAYEKLKRGESYNVQI